MKSLVLAVEYRSFENKAKSFLAEVKSSGVLGEILKEEGLIRYEYFLNAENPDVIFLYEEWASEEYQKKHLTTENMLKLKEIKDKYIEKTSIRKLTDA